MKIDTKMAWLATCMIVTAPSTTSTAIAEGAANTGAVTIVDKLPFPEGPLFVMYVTAVEDVTGAPFHGSIWKIDLNRQ